MALTDGQIRSERESGTSYNAMARLAYKQGLEDALEGLREEMGRQMTERRIPFDAGANRAIANITIQELAKIVERLNKEESKRQTSSVDRVIRPFSCSCGNRFKAWGGLQRHLLKFNRAGEEGHKAEDC